MSASLNTNLAALQARLNLERSQASQATAVARLASGQRLNSARDDAAGMAISGRMAAQIRGLNVAGRNTRDGISLAQTAEGGLGSIAGNLQRIRELAVQAANATNSASDRASLQAEAAQLVAEIDRVAQQTTFNGRALLDGTFTAQAFQVGANSGQSISIAGHGSARASVLGLVAATPPPPTTTTTSSVGLGVGGTIDGPGQLVINGVDIYQGVTINADAGDIAAAITAAGISGLTATAAANVAVGSWSFTGLPVAGYHINGVNMAIGLSGVRSTDVSLFASYVNGNFGTTGVSAVDNGSGLTLTQAGGHNILTGGSWNPAAVGLGGLPWGYGYGWPPAADPSQRAVIYGSYSLSYTGSAGLSISGSRLAGLGLTAMTPPPVPPGSGSAALAQLDISSVSGANAALGSLDVALATIGNNRALLGAVQNRFDATLSQIAGSAEDASASRSRIVDADYAAETTALARSQILQSAGLAMVAQANTAPGWVLTLLR